MPCRVLSRSRKKKVTPGLSRVHYGYTVILCRNLHAVEPYLLLSPLITETALCQNPGGEVWHGGAAVAEHRHTHRTSLHVAPSFHSNSISYMTLNSVWHAGGRVQSNQPACRHLSASSFLGSPPQELLANNFLGSYRQGPRSRVHQVRLCAAGTDAVTQVQTLGLRCG
jgi:hypothetical protein